MDFLELVKKRVSVRGYEDKPVEEKKLSRILESARFAPSAANMQPLKFIVIKTKGKEKMLREIYDRDWFMGAPVVICVCIKPSEAWSRMDGMNFAMIDAAIAVDHLILAATELGLGTCWIGAFNPARAKENLTLPKGTEPLVFVTLGYPKDKGREKVRKSVDELVEFR